MEIKTTCELCGRKVTLTSSYKGQRIICLSCNERCSCCGAFLKVEERLMEYGYDTFYKCNNPRCKSKGIESN